VALVYDVLYPWVRGGAEKRYWEIARRLPAHGFEPHLFGPQYWEGPASIRKEGVWLHGVCAPRPLYGSAGTRSIGEAVAFARDLFPVLMRHHFELIDCCAFPYFPWFSARAVAALRGVPILTTWPELWGAYWRSYLGPVKGTIAQVIEQATVRLSQSHLCLSPFTERRVRAACARAQVTPIPAGIDARTLAGYARPAAERRGIIFIGRLLAHKRVSDLLQALALTRATVPDATLTVIGQGPEETHLHALTKHLSLEAAVTFRADLSEEQLYTQLGQARCLVLPSEREGQGIVVAEAQATGTPPIVARGPETAAVDFVVDGKSGLSYPVSDVGALTTTLLIMLGNDTRHCSITAGAQQAAARLDWDRVVVPSVVGLYGSLLNPRGPR